MTQDAPSANGSLAHLEEKFEPTFTGSEYEHGWIMDSLGGFWQDGLITDVLYCVKGGKEATVYCCQAHPSMDVELMAAKVYRPRKFRALRNDAVYREGREVLDVSGKALRDQRSHRAIKNRTQRGREMKAASWLRHEYDTLRLLHRAGAERHLQAGVKATPRRVRRARRRLRGGLHPEEPAQP